MRGNLRVGVEGRLGIGSIPACAGEPTGIHLGVHSGEVYPRVCGGTPPGIVRLDSAEGLSPRVRGNHDVVGTEERVGGSIPACAGEPSTMPRLAWSPKVYPRVCGGTNPWPNPRLEWYGLSPRVRGNLASRGRFRNIKRSIPACAGEP